MAELKYQPVRHDHEAFLRRASKRRGFRAAYDALAVEYALAREMLSARTRAGLTQEAVAVRMGTTKSAVSRLEATGTHAPSVASLRKYAKAVGCRLEVKFVPNSTPRRNMAQPGLRTAAPRGARRST